MNVDFVDVCIVMFEMGYVMMGFGVVSGEDCVEEVVEMVIFFLLLEDIDLFGVCGVLVNIMVGFDLCLDEFEMVGNIICVFVFDNVIVVIGIFFDLDMNDELCVIVVVIGIGMDKCFEIILVINKQVQQLVMDCYQQYGMVLLIQEQKLVVKVVNDNVL